MRTRAVIWSVYSARRTEPGRRRGCVIITSSACSKRGKPAIGTWLSYGAPLAVEAMTTVGFDWLTIDWEHNAIDIETVALMMMAMRGTGCAPMVRLPQGHHENIKRC